MPKVRPSLPGALPMLPPVAESLTTLIRPGAQSLDLVRVPPRLEDAEPGLAGWGAAPIRSAVEVAALVEAGAKTPVICTAPWLPA